MTAPAGPAGTRLAREELGPRARHAWAASIVMGLIGLTAIGFVHVPIALLAAGAGAGYSLSGSV